MAKKQTNTQTVSKYKDGTKKKRPGVHAKTKTSKSKNSQNYTKAYRGQGH